MVKPSRKIQNALKHGREHANQAIKELRTGFKWSAREEIDKALDFLSFARGQLKTAR